MSANENGREDAPQPAAPTAPTAPPRRGRPMVTAVVALALLGATGFALLRWRAQRRYRLDMARAHAGAVAAASNPELTLLAPLRVGSVVEGATIARISAVEAGLIHVDLRKEGEEYHLAVGLVHPGYDAPRAGRYAVYIWERVPTPVASALAGALARAMLPHANRPPPPGLTAGTFDSPAH